MSIIKRKVTDFYNAYGIEIDNFFDVVCSASEKNKLLKETSPGTRLLEYDTGLFYTNSDGLEWVEIELGGGGGTGKAQFVGNVQKDGSFPTTRFDGSALSVNDYVRPTGELPFTIGTCTFNNLTDKGIYKGTGWVVEAGSPSGVSSFAEIEGEPEDNLKLKIALDNKANAVDLDDKQDKLTANGSVEIDSSNHIDIKDKSIGKIKVDNGFFSDNELTGTTKAENVIVSGDLTSEGDTTLENVVVNKEISVPEPKNDSDATNKKYVDEEVGKKQDKLVAGTNIKIDGNVISATGEIAGSVAFKDVTGDPSDNAKLNDSLNAKQDVLEAGDNIKIEGNRISATGGSVKIDNKTIVEDKDTGEIKTRIGGSGYVDLQTFFDGTIEKAPASLISWPFGTEGESFKVLVKGGYVDIDGKYKDIDEYCGAYPKDASNKIYEIQLETDSNLTFYAFDYEKTELAGKVEISTDGAGLTLSINKGEDIEKIKGEYIPVDGTTCEIDDDGNIHVKGVSTRFADIEGDAYDNKSLAVALNDKANVFDLESKQNKLTAGTNIEISSDNTISASYPQPAIDFQDLVGEPDNNAKLKEKFDNITESLSDKDVVIKKQETATEGYLATYNILQGKESVGKIDLPKDYLLKSGEVKTCTEDDKPVAGYKVGDKYIDFVINVAGGTEEQHLYVLVKDMGKEYSGSDTITVSDSNVLSVKDGSITNDKLGSDVAESIASKGIEVIEVKLTSTTTSGTITAEQRTLIEKNNTIIKAVITDYGNYASYFRKVNNSGTDSEIIYECRSNRVVDRLTFSGLSWSLEEFRLANNSDVPTNTKSLVFTKDDGTQVTIEVFVR